MYRIKLRRFLLTFLRICLVKKITVTWALRGQKTIILRESTWCLRSGICEAPREMHVEEMAYRAPDKRIKDYSTLGILLLRFFFTQVHLTHK